MGREEPLTGTRAFCDLDLRERDNLDDEMTALVKGTEKKYGFMPNFLKLFATDNRRLRVFMEQYMELMRPDSGLTGASRVSDSHAMHLSPHRISCVPIVRRLRMRSPTLAAAGTSRNPHELVETRAV